MTPAKRSSTTEVRSFVSLPRFHEPTSPPWIDPSQLLACSRNLRYFPTPGAVYSAIYDPQREAGGRRHGERLLRPVFLVGSVSFFLRVGGKKKVGVVVVLPVLPSFYPSLIQKGCFPSHGLCIVWR